jgi:hypothetical protein
MDLFGVGQHRQHCTGEVSGVGGVVSHPVVHRVETAEVIDGVLASVLDRLSGADSQWAETMRIALGRGIARAQANNSSIHGVSSKSGGAP